MYLNVLGRRQKFSITLHTEKSMKLDSKEPDRKSHQKKT